MTTPVSILKTPRRSSAFLPPILPPIPQGRVAGPHSAVVPEGPTSLQSLPSLTLGSPKPASPNVSQDNGFEKGHSLAARRPSAVAVAKKEKARRWTSLGHTSGRPSSTGSHSGWTKEERERFIQLHGRKENSVARNATVVAAANEAETEEAGDKSVKTASEVLNTRIRALVVDTPVGKLLDVLVNEGELALNEFKGVIDRSMGTRGAAKVSVRIEDVISSLKQVYKLLSTEPEVSELITLSQNQYTSLLSGSPNTFRSGSRLGAQPSAPPSISTLINSLEVKLSTSPSYGFLFLSVLSKLSQLILSLKASAPRLIDEVIAHLISAGDGNHLARLLNFARGAVEYLSGVPLQPIVDTFHGYAHASVNDLVDFASQTETFLNTPYPPPTPDYVPHPLTGAPFSPAETSARLNVLLGRIKEVMGGEVGKKIWRDIVLVSQGLGGKDGVQRVVRDWKRVLRLARGERERGAAFREVLATLAKGWTNIQVGIAEGRDDDGNRVVLRDLTLQFENIVPEEVSVNRKNTLWSSSAGGGKKTMVELENIQLKFDGAKLEYEGQKGVLNATLAFDVAINVLDRTSSPIPYFESCAVKVKAIQMDLQTGSMIKDTLFKAAKPLVKHAIKARVSELIQDWISKKLLFFLGTKHEIVYSPPPLPPPASSQGVSHPATRKDGSKAPKRSMSMAMHLTDVAKADATSIDNIRSPPKADPSSPTAHRLPTATTSNAVFDSSDEDEGSKVYSPFIFNRTGGRVGTEEMSYEEYERAVQKAEREYAVKEGLRTHEYAKMADSLSPIAMGDTTTVDAILSPPVATQNGYGYGMEVEFTRMSMSNVTRRLSGLGTADIDGALERGMKRGSVAVADAFGKGGENELENDEPAHVSSIRRDLEFARNAVMGRKKLLQASGANEYVMSPLEASETMADSLGTKEARDETLPENFSKRRFSSSRDHEVGLTKPRKSMSMYLTSKATIDTTLIDNIASPPSAASHVHFDINRGFRPSPRGSTTIPASIVQTPMAEQVSDKVKVDWTTPEGLKSAGRRSSTSQKEAGLSEVELKGRRMSGFLSEEAKRDTTTLEGIRNPAVVRQ